MNKEQSSNERKMEMLKKMGVDDKAGSTAAIDLIKFEVNHLHVEYFCDEGDLLMHFFWREPPAKNAPPVRDPGSGMPIQDNYAPWPREFREKLWDGTIGTFKLRDELNRVELEWIPEFQSWCVFVRGVANIIAPSQHTIEGLAHTVLGSLAN